LRADAYLPEQWIEDGLARISIYQRIARAESIEEIASLSGELRDRFGPIPKPAEMLLMGAEISLLARKLSIAGISRKQGVAVITFSEKITAKSPILADLHAHSKLPLRFLATMPMQAVVEIGQWGAEKEVAGLRGFLALK
jgi:transcription-repair coupling factor (superfamily II helicase)